MTDPTERWLEQAGVDPSLFEAYLARYQETEGGVADADVPALALMFICREAGASGLSDYVYRDGPRSIIDIEKDQAEGMLAEMDEGERNQAWEFVRRMTGAVVRPSCPDCEGSGKLVCPACDGDALVPCLECEGEGCEKCVNSGEVDCEECGGTGIITCGACRGTGTVPASDVSRAG